MEPNLLAWVGQELYSTEGGAVRRQLVSRQAGFQDVVLTLGPVRNREQGHYWNEANRRV
jgi:hypothetical protein